MCQDWSTLQISIFGIDGGAGGRGVRSPPPPAPPTKIWRGHTKPPDALVLKNIFTDVFDNTCDIGDFRMHIFCPQTTQELPKKHHEVRGDSHMKGAGILVGNFEGDQFGRGLTFF